MITPNKETLTRLRQAYRTTVELQSTGISFEDFVEQILIYGMILQTKILQDCIFESEITHIDNLIVTTKKRISFN